MHKLIRPGWLICIALAGLSFGVCPAQTKLIRHVRLWSGRSEIGECQFRSTFVVAGRLEALGIFGVVSFSVS
jgi:hypothetical protein